MNKTFLRTFSLIMILLAGFTFVGCNNQDNGNNNDNNNNPPKIDDTPFRDPEGNKIETDNYANELYGYNLNVPADWDIVEENSENVELKSKTSDDRVDIQTIDNPENKPLSDWVNDDRSGNDPYEYSLTATTIGADNVAAYEFKHTGKGFENELPMYYLELDGKILAITPATNAKSTFQQVINSLTFN